jgi:hypothetical protein
MSIREMIDNYRNEIHNTDLTPSRASEILVELSALVGNVAEELKNREMEYNRRFFALLTAQEGRKSVALAKAESLTTPEWEAVREAQNSRETLMELIRSLKYYLKTKLEESREAYGKQF